MDINIVEFKYSEGDHQICKAIRTSIKKRFVLFVRFDSALHHIPAIRYVSYIIECENANPVIDSMSNFMRILMRNVVFGYDDTQSTKS